MRSRKIPLKHKPAKGGAVHWIDWNACLPFAASEHGVLIHRVRYAKSYMRDGSRSHDSVTYWCGNGTWGPLLFESPPAGRIVCATCEARATSFRNGLPTTDELAGRHVHKGVAMARKTCCEETN